MRATHHQRMNFHRVLLKSQALDDEWPMEFKKKKPTPGSENKKKKKRERWVMALDNPEYWESYTEDGSISPNLPSTRDLNLLLL